LGPVTNARVKHLGFNSRSVGLFVSCGAALSIHQCEFSGTTGLITTAFSYPVVIRECLFTVIGQINYGYSAGMMLIGGTQFSDVADCQFHGTPMWQTVTSVGNGGGTSIFQNNWVVARAGRGGMYFTGAITLLLGNWVDDDGG